MTNPNNKDFLRVGTQVVVFPMNASSTAVPEYGVIAGVADRQSCYQYTVNIDGEFVMCWDEQVVPVVDYEAQS